MKACPFCAEDIQDAAIVCKHCGRDLPGGPPAAAPPAPAAPGAAKNAGIGCLVVVVLLMALGYLVTPRSGDSATERNDDLVTAWTMCQQFVKGQLRSPATADFPWDYRDRVTETRTGFVVRAYVDSQNGFGALLRTNFECKVMPKGDKWELVELTLDGRKVR